MTWLEHFIGLKHRWLALLRGSYLLCEAMSSMR
jgi:hypothetical protein